MVEKDPDNERPIPMAWRTDLKIITDSFVNNATPTALSFVKLTPMDDDSLNISLANIRDYPDEIGLLSEKSWETSIHIWMGRYWDILLDLTDANGGVSDLVLDGKMYEDVEGYIFKPHLIYVP